MAKEIVLSTMAQLDRDLAKPNSKNHKDPKGAAVPASANKSLDSNRLYYRPEGLPKADAVLTDSSPGTEKTYDPYSLSPYAHMHFGTFAQGRLDIHLAPGWDNQKEPAVIKAVNDIHPGLGSHIEQQLDTVTADMARELLEKHLPSGYEHLILPEIPFQITKKQAEIIKNGIYNPQFETFALNSGFSCLDDCVKQMILNPQFSLNFEGKNLTVDDIFNSQNDFTKFLSSAFSYYIYNLDSSLTLDTTLYDVQELVTAVIARPDLMVLSVKPGSFAAHYLSDIQELLTSGSYFGRIPLLDMDQLSSEKAGKLRVAMELLANGLLTDDPDIILTLVEGKACFHKNVATKKKTAPLSSSDGDEPEYDYSPVTFDRNRLQPEQVTDISHTAEAVRGGFRNFFRRVYAPYMSLSGTHDESRAVEPTINQINDLTTRIMRRSRYLFTRIYYPIFDLESQNLKPAQLLESLDPKVVRNLKPDYAINSVSSPIIIERLKKFSEYLTRRVTKKIPDKTPEETVVV